MDWLSRGLSFAKKTLKTVTDADLALQLSMAGCIEAAAARYAVDPGAKWRPGEPLKLLFVGYAGTRNTGADVRVEEMQRQFRHLLGDDVLEMSILTFDPERTKNYFPAVRQIVMPLIFPKFLTDTVHEHHGVVTCEGSMFKSKFANALSTLMVGGLGLASVEGKLAIAYGGEAGQMDRSLEQLVERYCRDSFIVARNHNSREVLGRLGIPSHAGTDTAWTYEPAPADVGEQMLRDAGWDGEQPVLAICPINAFWWPVKADAVRRTLQAVTGSRDKSHYRSVYFHNDGPEVDRKQAAYIEGLATAARRFRAEHDVFVIAVGMEMLDRGPCTTLSEQLGGVPLFISDDWDMDAMVSLLRRCSQVVSSRYHALVCSMPGLVPSIGVTMDERIHNLMSDRGTPELALEVDDPALADGLYEALCRLHREGTSLSEGIGRTVVKNLEIQGRMGQLLVEYLRQELPELPIGAHLGAAGDPWDHLPPLGRDAALCVERFGPCGSVSAPTEEAS